MKTLLVVPETRPLVILAVLLGLGTIAFMVFFLLHDKSLPTYSVIQYELAGTAQHARAMFNAWQTAGQALVRQSLYIDFAFMPVYALAFAALTLLAARAALGGAQTWGLWLALAPFAAWAFDIVENIGLLVALRRPESPSAMALAVSATASRLKFGLLGLSAFSCLGVTIQRLVTR